MNRRMKIIESASGDDLTELWEAVHSARKNSVQIKVDKATLTRLLLDHNNLMEYYHKTK